MPQQLHKLVPVPNLQSLEHFNKAQNQSTSRRECLGIFWHILGRLAVPGLKADRGPTVHSWSLTNHTPFE